MDSVEGLPKSGADEVGVSQEVVRLLLGATDRLWQHYGSRAAEFGLSASQAKVLVSLQPEEAVPMRALAKRLRYDASNLTGLVDKLEERGALERRPDPTDRRVKALVLTEEGRRLREAFWGRLVGNGGPFGSLDGSQLRDLRNLLRLAFDEK